MSSFSPEQLERYRETARQREAQRQQRHQARQQRGWQVARQAAALLKQEFGATQVYLFGSLLDASRIHAESDVDLAVAGLPDARYLEAVARLLDLSDLSVDLVQLEHAKPRILETIQHQGVSL